MSTDEFETRIARLVERLQTPPWQEIERQVTQKRLRWLQQAEWAANPSPRKGQAPPCSSEHPTPRQAFELLFFDYMGLSPVDLPVVSETPEEIVWRSQNPCPTLEAARRLGLDTRQVCRAISESPVQAFLSQLDPQLRFSRSYEEIRPYTDYCLERITRVHIDDR